MFICNRTRVSQNVPFQHIAARNTAIQTKTREAEHTPYLRIRPARWAQTRLIQSSNISTPSNPLCPPHFILLHMYPTTRIPDFSRALIGEYLRGEHTIHGNPCRTCRRISQVVPSSRSPGSQNRLTCGAGCTKRTRESS